jgi:tRNA-dihydrouridine synthase B
MPGSVTAGGVSASSPIWLAPLAGITTRSFREFHRKMGAGLAHTEMTSAVGLSYKNKRTSRLVGDDTEPGPIVLQLFAPDARSLERGAELALSMRRFDALEINMACPMPKVAKKGSGAALLDRPEEARRMTEALKIFGLPVWVKLRIIDPAKGGATTGGFCETLIEAGADLLLLHGRTPAQRYEGSSDKETVCETARNFPGLVAASGDYYEPSDAMAYLEGGCAAVLAARGALRDAYLIPKTPNALGYDAPQNLLHPNAADQIDALREIGRFGLAHEGERFTLVMVRRMLAGFFKNLPGASAIRQGCSACRDWGSLEKFLLGLKI